MAVALYNNNTYDKKERHLIVDHGGVMVINKASYLYYFEFVDSSQLIKDFAGLWFKLAVALMRAMNSVITNQ